MSLHQPVTCSQPRVIGMECGLEWDRSLGPAVLRAPDGEVKSGLVMLHGASDGRARQPLFDQVANALAPLGIAVLSYQRRSVENDDTPLDVQAADAVAAMQALSSELGCPVGVFGFSQGAWAAALAAADEVADHLIVLGCSGVSPAAQMRFFTDDLLRRRGFSDQDRARMRQLRTYFEDDLRRTSRSPRRREEYAAALRATTTQAWFEYAYLPSEPPPVEATWLDMDFDPVLAFGKVRVPVLAMWGTDEECVPRDPSRQAWQGVGAQVTLVDLPGCGHWPVVGSGAPGYAGWEEDPLSADFIGTLAGWIQARLHDRP